MAQVLRWVPRSARSMGWLALGIASALAILALIGWVLGIEALKSIVPHATPMRIITALCFLLSVAALACLESRISVCWNGLLPRVAGVVVSCVGLLTVAGYLIEASTKSPWSLGQLPVANLFLAPPTRMAVITAILFSVFGLVLLLLGAGTRRAAGVAHAALLPVALMSYLVVVGYLFHVRAFYEWMHLGVALNTGIAFCALCLAAFCACPDTWLTRVFTGEEAGAIMARRLLPGLLLLPLLIGWLRIEGERAGLFESELGVALVAVTYTICFLGLIWLSAASVNRMDARRRGSEQALRQSERRWATTLSSIGDAVIATDGAGNITFLNPTAEELTGWPLAEAAGRPVTEVFHIISEQTRREVECPVVRALREGRAVGIANHTLLVRKDGSELPIDDSGAPIRNESGEVVGVVLVFRDITPRRRAEDERETTVEFLRLVNESRGTVDLIRAAVTFFQQRSGCEAVGIRLKEGDDYPYYEVRGFPEQFVELESSLCARDDVGETIRDSDGYPVMACMCGNVIQGRFDPSKPFFTERGSFWTNSTTQLLATTTEADRQARTRNRCNGEGYESVALIALRLGEERLGLVQLNDRQAGRFSPDTIAVWERLAGYLAVALAHARAEERLQQSHELLNRHVDNSPLATVEWDGEFHITRWAGEAESVFGWTANEVLGKRIDELPWVYEEDLPSVEAVMADMLSGKRPSNVNRNRNIRKDGRVIHCEWYNTAVRDAEGRLVSVLSQVLDVTARKQAEAALLAAERARAELAETLNREIGHRVKNNLSMVAGMLQMQIASEQDARVAETLQAAIARLYAFAAVHDQLALTGTGEVDVTAAVRQYAEAARRLSLQGGIAISVEGGALQYPGGVAASLSVVANELITNGIKHGGPDGDGRLHVDVRLARDDGAFRLSVWNSGNPVPADMDLSQQTGMGLSLVQGLVVGQYGGSFTLGPERGGSLAQVILDDERLREG